MGRNIFSIIFGGAGTSAPTAASAGAIIKGEITNATVDVMCDALKEAKHTIIILGYGLAVAQAQFAVFKKEVQFFPSLRVAIKNKEEKSSLTC